MIIRVIDFETTALENGSVCEAGWVDVVHDGEIIDIENAGDTLVRPTTEMTVEAMAVHHITPESAARGIPWDEVCEVLKSGADVFAAHNAKFERQFFNPEGSKWIDTYKVALHLWPDAPSHSNQVLRYYLGLPNLRQFMPPHRALPDAYVTAEILMAALEHLSPEDMIDISSRPALLPKMRFGKHRGMAFKDVPSDYLQWVLSQDMDEDVLYTAKKTLESRG